MSWEFCAQGVTLSTDIGMGQGTSGMLCSEKNKRAVLFLFLREVTLITLRHV